MKKFAEWFKKNLLAKDTRSNVHWLCLALAGIMAFSLFASLAQSHGGKTEVVDIYANIPGVGDNISMTLYLPKAADADHQVPMVVATHGYLNNKEMVDMTYVEVSRRGYAVVAVDASVMGDYHGESGALGESFATGAGLVDVIDYFTQTLDDGSQMFPWLDFKNIGVIGHSMGGSTVNSVVQIFADRETAAFNLLKTKYTLVGNTSYAIYQALTALAEAELDEEIKADINADIEVALSANKIRACLAMAPMSGQLTTKIGLETIYGTLIGGSDEMFLTYAGASAILNSVNTQMKAIDERNIRSFFPTYREYATQYEYFPLNNDKGPLSIAMIGNLNPDYILTGTTVYGEAATGTEVYSRTMLPRDLEAFVAAGIADPMAGTDAEKSEYIAYLTKKDYFDKIWKSVRDWNAGVDDDGNAHVQVTIPSTMVTLLKPVQDGDDYGEGALVVGGIYTKDGLDTSYSWETGVGDEIDETTGLRKVFRTFYISQREIHPRNHFSMVSAANVSTFFMTAFGASEAGDLIAPTNQGWWVKEMFNFTAMLCFLLMLIPLCALLIKVPFFAKITQPVPAPTARLKKWYEWAMYLIPALIIAAFSAISMSLFTAGVGYSMFSTIFSQAYFNQTTTNYVSTWAFWNGVFGFVVFTVFYWIWNRRRGARFNNIGVTTPAGGIVRSLILAVTVVSIIYLSLGLVQYIFNVDFRLWTFVAKWFHSYKLGTAINYMFIFVFYYIILALFTANNRWKNIPEWLSITMCVVFTILGMVVMQAYQYGSDQIAGGGFSGTGAAGSLQYIGLFPVIPILVFATILSRKLYKITGSIWLPAFVNTILFTLMAVSGTIVSGGFFRIFGL